MSVGKSKVYLTDPLKSAASGITAAFCLAVVIAAVSMEEFIAAGVFAAITMLFGYIFVKSCRLMRISKEGIETSFRDVQTESRLLPSEVTPSGIARLLSEEQPAKTAFPRCSRRPGSSQESMDLQFSNTQLPMKSTESGSLTRTREVHP